MELVFYDEESAQHTRVAEAGQLRAAMRQVVSAVHIVTTADPWGACGFTASSVVSLTDAPATIVVCMNASNESADRFLVNRHFCVNTLKATDHELADAFAGKDRLRDLRSFANAAWAEDDNGIPRLRNAAASMQCVLLGAWRVGTHYLLVGRVAQAQACSNDAVLAYLDQRYIAAH